MVRDIFEERIERARERERKRDSEEITYPQTTIAKVIVCLIFTIHISYLSVTE